MAAVDWDQFNADVLDLATGMWWASRPGGIPDWDLIAMDTIARVESYAEYRRRGWSPPPPPDA